LGRGYPNKEPAPIPHATRTRYPPGLPLPLQYPSSDALGAFTRFFRAEAQASTKPFSTPRTKGTKRRELSPAEELAIRKEAHAAPPTRRTPNLSLDNRDRRRERPPYPRAPGTHNRVAEPLVAPAPAKQANPVATRSSGAPTPGTVPAPESIFEDADVLQLIARAEQDDLDPEPQLRSEFLVALGAMQVSRDPHSSAPSPAPSA